MMLLREWFLLLVLLGLSQADKEAKIRKRLLKRDDGKKEGDRALKGGSGSGKRSGSGYGDDYYGDDYHHYDDDDYHHQYNDDFHHDIRDTLTITLKITNLSYLQPFGPLFCMVHNADARPLFTLGEEAPVALRNLAEFGDPTQLAEAYAGAEGVFMSGIYTEGSPWHGGADIFVTLPYRPLYPYVTIAGMFLNSNDGFVALNGVRIIPNLVITGPGYDAGTEINNEQCSSVPGPACDDNDNAISGRGEGFVHVHRGIHGIADLEPQAYDWRNPMIRVEMMNPYT